MKTDTTHQAGRRRLFLGLAVVGATLTLPLTVAAPAIAAPAVTPGVVQTEYPRCDDWNHRGWEYCDRDRGYRCDNDWYGRDHRYDRDWEYCDRGRGGGYHNWFPWGWFGSS
ncbi:hypothetical protein [Nocardia sp. NPDC050718]|uniref:hypothetical protein n=1 Tax=Nocardia sp. NPDC050718 TaxID=3155788 RepID=UPI0033FF743B